MTNICCFCGTLSCPPVSKMASGTAADLRKRSIFTYNRVLVFNYDVQCRKPFRSYNRSSFSEEDIDPSWFTGPLTRFNRKLVMPLSELGGGRFSIFAKIEAGKVHSNVFLVPKKV